MAPQQGETLQHPLQPTLKWLPHRTSPSPTRNSASPVPPRLKASFVASRRRLRFRTPHHDHHPDGASQFPLVDAPALFPPRRPHLPLLDALRRGTPTSSSPPSASRSSPLLKPEKNLNLIYWSQLHSAEFNDHLTLLKLHFDKEQTGGVILSLKPIQEKQRPLLRKALEGRLAKSA